MTPPRSPLTRLGDHVTRLGRTTEGQAALERFRRAGLETEGAEDLGALVRQWDGRGGGGRRARMLETLVRLAPDDDVAALCAVVAWRPELGRMARHLSRASLDAEEAQSDVIAIAWEVLALPPETKAGGRASQRAVDAIWTETRRRGGRRRRTSIDLVPLPEEATAVLPDVDPLERWPGLLAAAVARGVLTPRQVVVIARTRMDDRPLAEVARSLGRGYDAVQKDRQRGEAALRTFASTYYSSESE